jgi:AcrR family transcriptional regulator
MYRQGIQHTSLDEVLKYCGAGKSQLYHYFDGKQDLALAVVQTQLEKVLAGQPRLERLESWRDFELWASAFLARHSSPEGPLACRLGRFASEVDDDEDLREALSAAFVVWQGFLERGLRRLREDGRLREDADPAALASATMAAVQGGLMLATLHRDVGPLREAMAMAMSHLRAHAVND